MLKIKNYFFSIIFLLFSITFSLFLIQQATNHTIWWKKWTLRPKIPPGHLGWQLLKPLGSEATVNQHIPLATISYTTTITTISVTCHFLHSPTQLTNTTQPHAHCLVAAHWFLFYTSSYFTILMCITLITASWLCRSSVSQPLIVFFHFLYSPILHQTYLHTLVAQPYGYAEAVQTQPHCCVLYLSPL